MTILPMIALGCLAGGVLSVLAAATCAFTVLSSAIPRLVSYAVGVMLATVFLGLLPEALATGLAPQTVLLTVLAGVVGFFVLEKIALWRHCHEDCTATPRPAAFMIVLGDGVHNFVDGVLIAGAFTTDIGLGVATTLAVIMHEVPQEVGDFLVLLHAGYTRRRALLLNLSSGLASLAGGVAGYFALAGVSAAVPYVIALAAASFLYIATADLMPHLHARRDARSAAWQIALLSLGIGTVAASQALVHGVFNLS